MNQGFSGDEVLIGQQGTLGVITLNRPKALNALSLEMIRQIAAALQKWEKDASVAMVLFVGAGERAFCAGGDLKIFHRAGMDYRKGVVPPVVPSVFFAEEYSLNRQIFHYPKPTIAFMNGITMGGGFGIAGNCQHKIATEKTVFAMPETGIGFFPDVGSVYHLLRTPGSFGHYLALTGKQIGPGDMLHARLADFYMPTAALDDLIGKLKKSDGKIPLVILAWLAQPNPEPEMFRIHGDEIDAVFDFPAIHEIMTVLEQNPSAFSISTRDILRKRSPSSLAVTARHLDKSRGKSFDDIIRTDFILAQHFLARMDLYEGIRAALIERDNAPCWDPVSLEAVSDDYVRRYFQPTGRNLDDVQIFAA
jgi:enoyl-CoA hydratase